MRNGLCGDLHVLDNHLNRTGNLVECLGNMHNSAWQDWSLTPTGVLFESPDLWDM